MLKNLKIIIKETAYSAVKMAEATLGSASGKQKKQLAIEFIVSKLPVVQPIKAILMIFLSKFIDKSIEQAVEYMKNER